MALRVLRRERNLRKYTYAASNRYMMPSHCNQEYSMFNSGCWKNKIMKRKQYSGILLTCYFFYYFYFFTRTIRLFTLIFRLTVIPDSKIFYSMNNLYKTGINSSPKSSQINGEILFQPVKPATCILLTRFWDD